jgi:hypothetical protein
VDFVPPSFTPPRKNKKKLDEKQVKRASRARAKDDDLINIPREILEDPRFQKILLEDAQEGSEGSDDSDSDWVPPARELEERVKETVSRSRYGDDPQFRDLVRHMMRAFETTKPSTTPVKKPVKTLTKETTTKKSSKSQLEKPVAARTRSKGAVRVEEEPVQKPDKAKSSRRVKEVVLEAKPEADVVREPILGTVTPARRQALSQVEWWAKMKSWGKFVLRSNRHQANTYMVQPHVSALLHRSRNESLAVLNQPGSWLAEFGAQGNSEPVLDLMKDMACFKMELASLTRQEVVAVTQTMMDLTGLKFVNRINAHSDPRSLVSKLPYHVFVAQAGTAQRVMATEVVHWARWFPSVPYGVPLEVLGRHDPAAHPEYPDPYGYRSVLPSFDSSEEGGAVLDDSDRDSESDQELPSRKKRADAHVKNLAQQTEQLRISPVTLAPGLETMTNPFQSLPQGRPPSSVSDDPMTGGYTPSPYLTPAYPEYAPVGDQSGLTFGQSGFVGGLSQAGYQPSSGFGFGQAGPMPSPSHVPNYVTSVPQQVPTYQAGYPQAGQGVSYAARARGSLDPAVDQPVRMIPYIPLGDLKMFEGSENVTKAKKWYKEFEYMAEQGSWSDQTKCRNLALRLSGAAESWYGQLGDSRKKWTKLREAFREEYCTHLRSNADAYYTLKNSKKEQPLEFLYRLNKAAKKARVPIGSRTQVQQHVARYIEAMSDPVVNDLLAAETFDSIEEIVERLKRYRDNVNRSQVGSKSRDKERMVRPNHKEQPARAAMVCWAHDTDSSSNEYGRRENPRIQFSEDSSDEEQVYRADGRDPRKSGEWTEARKAEARREKPCYVCNKLGHWAQECPDKAHVVCGACKAPGHDADACRRKCPICDQVHAQGGCGAIKEFRELVAMLKANQGASVVVSSSAGPVQALN